jgi:hypothetical protein
MAAISDVRIVTLRRLPRVRPIKYTAWAYSDPTLLMRSRVTVRKILSYNVLTMVRRTRIQAREFSKH